MDRRSRLRAFAYGMFGWVIPGMAAAIPFVGAHETVGGQNLLSAGAVWLLGLGPLGCAVAGWLSARTGGDFWSGLAGVSLAVAAVLALDALVTVVGLGPFAFPLVLPLVLGYGVGFAIGAFMLRRTLKVSSMTARDRHTPSSE